MMVKMKTTMRGGLVAQYGNDSTQDKVEKQTTLKQWKTDLFTIATNAKINLNICFGPSEVKVKDKIPLTFSSPQFENKNEKKTKYRCKNNKYKYEKYLLRSKYMTPSNGVKVDGHIPSSTNAR